MLLLFMDTTSGAATIPPLDIRTVPEDLESLTFDAANFPTFPEFINNGVPTSPATVFIDDYLTPPQEVPAGTQGLLGFQDATEQQEQNPVAEQQGPEQ
jgi:hypothetical protein